MRGDFAAGCVGLGLGVDHFLQIVEDCEQPLGRVGAQSEASGREKIAVNKLVGVEFLRSANEGWIV